MSYPDENTPLLLLLVLAARHLTEGLQERLVEAGFDDHRVVHHNVMAHVTYEGIRITDLAERAGVTKQAISELVGDLERLGYVQRLADPADGRAKLITFTERGRRAVTAARESFTEMDDLLSDEVGHKRLHDVRHTLLGIINTPVAVPRENPDGDGGLAKTARPQGDARDSL